ncbi:hypothetical protein Taro_005454, partial [Colocasia esculenta]|nr:hypothetical protein [Colocasia esculenta]
MRIFCALSFSNSLGGCLFSHMARDVTASFGYDYILRQCRLSGRIDSNGCVSAFLERFIAICTLLGYFCNFPAPSRSFRSFVDSC